MREHDRPDEQLDEPEHFEAAEAYMDHTPRNALTLLAADRCPPSASFMAAGWSAMAAIRTEGTTGSTAASGPWLAAASPPMTTCLELDAKQPPAGGG